MNVYALCIAHSKVIVVFLQESNVIRSVRESMNAKFSGTPD